MTNTRHIPVHIISVESERQRGRNAVDVAYLQKPTSEALARALTDIKGFIARRVKPARGGRRQHSSIVELIGNSDVPAVSTGAAALARS